MKRICNRMIGFLAPTILMLFFGCVSLSSTRPNYPFAGPYPDKFTQLTTKNSLLAQEIGKLPELQDGVSNSELKAIEKICDFYAKAPECFDAAFKQMYQIGIPNVRRYCSPLQAVFWLAENDELSQELLDNYNLKELLDRGWRLNKPQRLSKKQVLEVIDGVKDKRQKKQFLIYVQNGIDDTIIRTIHGAYKTYPGMFSHKSKKILRGVRWSELNTVTDRLNAPELIDYYEKKLFKYKIGAFNSKYSSYNLGKVFRYHEGNCSQVTAFTVYCLRKAGYKAEEFHVISPSGKWDYHITTLFEVDGEKYIMDNAGPVKWGIEPYDNYVKQIPPVNH